MNIIAVDWGKDARKRSAYRAEVPKRTICHRPFDGSLSHLLECASSLEPPVLVGIDAATGFPIAPWERLAKACSLRSKNFIDFLFGPVVPSDFFNPVASPEDWSPVRPFVRLPAGKWSKNSFIEAANGGFFREVDAFLRGNPIFVTRGLAGSVGSGTMELWQELIGIFDSEKLRVWPFHGALDALLKPELPVISEIYPKACYGFALNEVLPGPQWAIS